jgi:hypothetical protein
MHASGLFVCQDEATEMEFSANVGDGIALLVIALHA